MKLFDALKKKPQPYAFVFMCQGPPMSSKFRIMGLNDHLQKAEAAIKNVVKEEHDIPDDHIIVFGPGWNSTHYSSAELAMDGEYDDMMVKVQAKLNEEGYSFDVRRAKVSKSTFKSGTLPNTAGYWLLYVIFDENGSRHGQKK